MKKAKKTAEVQPFTIKSEVVVEFHEQDDVSDYNSGKPFRIHQTPTKEENAELRSVTVTAPCGDTQQFSRRDFANLLKAGIAYLEATK